MYISPINIARTNNVRATAFNGKNSHRQKVLERYDDYQEKLLNVENEITKINEKINETPKKDIETRNELHKQRKKLQREMSIIEQESCYLKSRIVKYTLNNKY